METGGERSRGMKTGGVHQEIRIGFKSFPMNLIAGIIHLVNLVQTEKKVGETKNFGAYTNGDSERSGFGCFLVFWMTPGFKCSKYGFTAQFLGSHASPEASFACTLRCNDCICLKRQAAASSGSLFSVGKCTVIIKNSSCNITYL